MDQDPPAPEPSNPLEKFILKLTASMNGYTSLARDIGRTQKAIDRKLDSLIKLVNDSRGSDAIITERVSSLMSRADDIREMRLQISDVHTRLVETGAEIRITSERIRDYTPVHGTPLPTKAELEEESGINRRGFLITWKTIAVHSKHGIWWAIAGGGAMTTAYHFILKAIGHG